MSTNIDIVKAPGKALGDGEIIGSAGQSPRTFRESRRTTGAIMPEELADLVALLA
jgi:hypothetical protein